MGPFDQLGQLNELRKMRGQAMEMQKKLKAITHTHQKGEWSIKVTGDQKLEYAEKNGEPQPELVKAVNEALDAVQKESAKKMMEEGGLSNLLKGM